MSKDADKDVVESMDSQPARRRRKKSGLRIPSDNVPRNTPVSSSSIAGDSNGEFMDGEDDFGQSDGTVTPIPEDPNVVVAVAYTFGPVDAGDEQEPDDLDASSRDGGSDGAGSSVSRRADSRPHSSPLSTGARVPTEPEPPDDEPGDVQGIAADDDLDMRKTRRMPAVQLAELGLTDDFLNDEALDAGTARGRGDDSVDSVDIPIDEEEPEVAPRPAAEVPRRAATMALSDDDLEELIEPMEMAGQDASHIRRVLARSREMGRTTQGAATAQPQPQGTQSAATSQPQPLSSLESKPSYPDNGQTTAPSAAAKEPRSAPTLRKKPQASLEPGLPAAVAALEGAGMESPDDSPLKLGESLDDPSDSGEILSDDLIEEVDDSDVEVDPTPDQRSSPPPAPPSTSVQVKKPPPAPSRSPSSGKSESSEPAVAPKRRKAKPWFEEIFDEDYLRTLPFLTPQATQAEAAFVERALEVEPGSQLFDIGCGYGRHAMELAARGYQVIALDLSLPLLLRGADEAQRRGLNINFVHGDMRELNFEDQFDGAYCLFSTFGYFDDEANKKALQGIARALKPGCRLVIEILNRDYLIADLPARVWWEGDGCVVLEEVDFNYFSSRIVSNRSVVFDDGRQLEQEISMRAYSLHELGKLLHGVGFRTVEISGSMAMRSRFFGNKSREIIVTAEKRVLKESRAGIHAGPFPRSTTDVADVE